MATVKFNAFKLLLFPQIIKNVLTSTEDQDMLHAHGGSEAMKQVHTAQLYKA